MRQKLVLLSALYKNSAVIFLLAAVLCVAIIIWEPGISIAEQGQSGPVTCTQIIPMSEKNVSTYCSTLSPDQVCYGHQTVTIENVSDAAAPINFAKSGDNAPFNSLRTIKTNPLALDTADWGIAIFKIPTDKPQGQDTAPSVAFFLVGDASLTPPKAAGTTAGAACTGTTTRPTYLRVKPSDTEQSVQLLQASTTVNVTAQSGDGQWVMAENQGKTGWLAAKTVRLTCDMTALPVNNPSGASSTPGPNDPMGLPELPAFHFSTNDSQPGTCSDILPAGMLLVQGVKGYAVKFKANGADITIASSILLRAQPNGNMTISVLEGKASITANGQTKNLLAGQETVLPLGGTTGLDVSGPPAAPRYMTTSARYIIPACKIIQAAGFDVQCDVKAATRIPPTMTPPPSSCNERTLRPNGTVCIPNLGVFACNLDKVCNNGESSYTCPEDCGAPPPPGGLGGKKKKPTPKP